MFKSVDLEDGSEFEGYCYTNYDDNLEYVRLTPVDNSIVTFEDSTGKITFIYVEDIPKLIKALQMMYEYKKGN